MSHRLYEDYIVGKSDNQGRIVLHSDMNNFFASVECMLNPSIAGYPVAVCGSEEERHGIVLAKNYKAKEYGVCTAEPVRKALQKCPKLVIVSPHYDIYMEYSARAKSIYEEYTDRVEPFGSDEAWLELTNCRGIRTLEDGVRIANEIRCRIKQELKLTVSVGVSDCKSFAKLASDYKKPDAVTLISPQNYADIVLPLPISELIFAGPQTVKELARFGLHTFYDVVRSDPSLIQSILGKNGLKLYQSASGHDCSRVLSEEDFIPVKSIGNSFTSPRDLITHDDVKAMLCILSESVGKRLRCANLKCNGIQLYVRGSDLSSNEKQTRLRVPTNCTPYICEIAYSMFKQSFEGFLNLGIRSMGIRGINLSSATEGVQLSLFDKNLDRLDKLSRIDNALDKIRLRYGTHSVERGILMLKDSPAVKNGLRDESSMRCSFGFQ